MHATVAEFADMLPEEVPTAIDGCGVPGRVRYALKAQRDPGFLRFLRQRVPFVGVDVCSPGELEWAIAQGVQRVAWGMGAQDVSALRDTGELLANLKEPQAPTGMRDALSKVSMLKSALWDMSPKNVRSPACQEVVLEGKDVDLNQIPLQLCWPGDVAPLLTWGLVITKGPHAKRQNLGIYRQQLIGHNKLIMRWLSHRGGALDFRDHALTNPGKPFPIAVALGTDPATILGAVTPVPDSLWGADQTLTWHR